MQDPVEKGKPVTPLPDLMIIALDVKYLGMDNLGGKLVPAISITYSLKNNGQVAVAATDCNMQGFIGYDQRNPDLITGCGAVASQVKNVLIAPGAVLQGSIRCNVDFDRNRKPFYTLYADRGNTIRESNENNNTQQAGISGL